MAKIFQLRIPYIVHRQLKANKNARAIAKAKLELLQALKGNKGDDYTSKPNFDFLLPAHNCNQEQNTPQLALV